MPDINIEIQKSLVTDERGGDVTIYLSMGRRIGLHEAKRLSLVLAELIEICERYQADATETKRIGA